jgi:hypothetical protein
MSRSAQPRGSNSPRVPVRVTLTGDADKIGAALATLQVRPGSDNGEDIMVTVTATSIESVPSEGNDKGPGVAGNEIAVPTVVASGRFIIPVRREVVPLVAVAGSANGSEGTPFPLGVISITTNLNSFASQELFLEIATSSYPEGTQFFSGGSTVGTEVAPGFIRIPESALESLKILHPPNSSGPIELLVLAVLVDTTNPDTGADDVVAEPYAALFPFTLLSPTKPLV